MLYLLYGSNFKKSREKLHSLVDSLLKKKPGASFFKIDSSNFSESQIDELVGGQGLFEQKYIVQMDGLLENQKSKDFVMDRIKEISESDNIFVFIEENISKPVLGKIEKVAQKVQEFEGRAIDGRNFSVIGGGNLNLSDFNIFNLADAFGNRDKKRLWVLYNQAVRRNIPAEEIHGILNWQLRVMIISKKSMNAEKANLKHFVFNKSLRFSKNFEQGDLRKLSAKMVTMYHDARRGIVDFDTALEKFILELN